MKSKILIDVDEQGLSTVRVICPERGVPYYDDMDVRDKLVNRFLEGGMFALITRLGDNNDAEIHSMNALNVLANIQMIYGQLFKDSDSVKEFDQVVMRLASMIESVSGERSTAFEKKVEAQSLIHGCMAPHDYKGMGNTILKSDE